MMRAHPLVGRDEELERLTRFHSVAAGGKASVCFVSGEPGAGKTTLVEHFAHRLEVERPDAVVARGGCNAQAGTGEPYLPFREILAQLTGDVWDDLEQGRMSEENASRLRRLASASVQAFVESGPDLLDLLVPGGSLLARLGVKVAPDLPRRRRAAGGPKVDGEPAARARLDQEDVFAQITSVLDTLARKEPLVLVLEDLHWADEASAALLFHLYRRLGSAPVLMIGTYRPTEVGLGRDGGRHPLDPVLNEIKRYEGDVWIDLDARSEEGQRRLFDSLVDLLPNRLGEDVRDALFRRTRGHPLFTLELLRHLQEEGYLRQDDEGCWTADAVPDSKTLPARVEGVIAERVARLDESLQAALRVASIEGERFRAPIVARALDVDERSLIRQLGDVAERKHRIVRSEGLRQVAGERMAEYRFRHSLFQKYLYDSVDEIQRALLHEEVGEVLEAIFRGRTREIASELSRHFAAAGIPERAAKYAREAGDRALELFATGDAVRHYRDALAQLEHLRESPERDRMELDVLEPLGACLVASSGYASSETLAAYERARALCERLDGHIHAPILRALAIANLSSGHHRKAYEQARELLERASRERNPAWVVEGHYAMGVTSFWLGDFVASRDHFEQGIARYRPELAAVHAALYAQDPRVVCLCRLGWALWYLGLPDQAFERTVESVALAREIEHPHSLAYALCFHGHVHAEAGDASTAVAALDELRALADERPLPFWSLRSEMVLGWLEGAGDDLDAGAARMRRDIEAYAGAGNTLGMTQALAQLAGLHLRRRAIEDGFEALSEAFALAERTDERFYEAEMHRLRGELLLARGGDGADAEAEASFRRGLELARRQGPRWLELRAAISLGRLWRRADRTPEARALLREAADGFTAGDLVPDVREAESSWRVGLKRCDRVYGWEAHTPAP